MIIFLSIFIVFSLINAISAVELSDTNNNQFNNDNNILTIDENILESNGENTYEDLDGLEPSASNDLSENTDENLNPKPSSGLNAGNSIYISTAGDDNNGDGTKTKPFGSLEKAINSSSNGSTIYLSQGNYVGEKNLNIIIDKTLTIKGDSKETTIIDAESCARMFIMNSSAKLTLIGLTLINGYTDSESYGGTIYNDGGELTIINSTIENSSGALWGGAIYNNLGKLNIYNSTFINNSAYQYGGVIYTLGANHLENTNFTENQVTAEKGVGACVALGGTGYFNNCTFFKNFAIYSAAGILNIGNITVNNCSFINQTTNYTAGGISNHNYALINNSYFGDCDVRYYAAAILAPPDDTPPVTEVYNTIFERNHAGNHGAVINNYHDAKLSIINSAFLANWVGEKTRGDIALDEDISVLYCWWGQNEIYDGYYSPHSDLHTPEKIDASKWLVMSFTSSNGIIYQEKDNILNVNIKHYFDNETKEIKEYDEDINLPLEVTFYVEGGRVIRTMKLVNGTAQITYNPKTNVKAVYAKINNQTFRIDVKDKEDSSIIAEDLTKIYKNDSQLEIKLVDKNNQPLANKNITIYIAGKNYTRTTDSEGRAIMNINLKAGSYDTTVEFKDDLDYRKSSKTIKVTVLKDKSKIVASDLVKYYKNSSQLVVKLVDNKNNPLANQKVTINICNKDYVKVTDSKGMAKISINLQNGAYTAKIKFNGNDNYNASSKSVKINVLKPKMTPLKTKLKNKKDSFVVTFKDADGKVIKNAKVKFVLNGKTYIKTTDSKGQAKLAISLSVKKTYTIKTSFQSANPYGTSVLTTKINVV